MSAAPSLIPSINPTRNPSEKDLILDFLSEAAVVDTQSLTTPGNPRYDAADWLIDVDALNVKLETDPLHLLQRFTIALLYFSTGGSITTSSWTSCSAVPDALGPNETSAGGIQCFYSSDQIICAATEDFEHCEYFNETSQSMLPSKRFLSPTHECEWYGVSCNDDNEIFSIELGKSMC